MRELLEKTLAVNELDIKKHLRTAAAAGLIGAGAAGLGLQKGISQKPVEKPAVTAPAEEPAKKVSIDLSKIAEIESSNDPEAENTRTGARGLHQIMQPTWEEVVSKMGEDWSWDDAFDVEKNTQVADYYMNTEIPRLLKHFDIKDTVENRLAAYNWGVGHLNRAGSEWMEKAPQETLDYIEKYGSL